MQDELEAREKLLILMEEAGIDQVGQENIACMMLQNCFLGSTLPVKLGTVKTPTLTTFNDILKSHVAGKKAAKCSPSANVLKGKGNCHQQQSSSFSKPRDQMSNTERDRRCKINGK